MAEPGFEVVPADIRTFATFVDGQVNTLDQPITDVNGIKISPGDPAIIPGAQTLITTVDERKTQVSGYLTTMKTDLTTLAGNTRKVADMYDQNDDKGKDITDDINPVVNGNDK